MTPDSIFRKLLVNPLIRPLARRLFHRFRSSLIPLPTDVPEIAPITPVPGSFPGQRITLLAPSINQEHLFGGMATALALFSEIRNHCRPDISFRVVVLDQHPHPEAAARLPGFVTAVPEADRPESLLLTSLASSGERRLSVSPGDLFLATSWWSAYAGLRLIRHQSEFYRQPARPMVYLIQDYEPAFYNWSSRFILAESTYYPIHRIHAILNTQLLRDFFHGRGFRFEKEYVLEPRLNPELHAYLKTDIRKYSVRKHRILVYGRPNVPRNAFEILLMALHRWSETSPHKVGSWELLSVGESHDTVELKNGVQLRSLGKLELNRYAEYMKESAIGISFMISPHPSYPPLEMAHFGMLTLTNRFAGKDLANWHDNITSLENMTPESIADTLDDLIRAFLENPQKGETGASHVPSYLSNDTPFPFVPDLVNHFLASP
jgi:hypothetical protein